MQIPLDLQRRVLTEKTPIVYLTKKKLSIAPQLKILGVIYYYILTFIPHLHYIKQKVQIHTQNLSRIYSTNCGVTYSQLHDMYLRSIERYIVYGAPAWRKPTRNSQVLGHLEPIQRIPLFKITKAFCTLPNVSRPVLYNILPIDITLGVENFV